MMKGSLIALFVVAGFSSHALAEISSSQAKSDLSAVQKLAGSKLEKRLILQSCKKIAELADQCAGLKAKDLSEGQFQSIKASVIAALEAKAVEKEQEIAEALAPEESSSEVAEQSQASGAVSINVSQGNNQQQQQTTVVNSTAGSDCIAKVMANVGRLNQSLNSRLSKIGKNK
jgi:hypothetical protein